MSRAHSIVGATLDDDRPEHDFYPTPPEATHALLGAYPIKHWGERVWEPAAGNGAMSDILHARLKHATVFSSDIDPRRGDIAQIDFLTGRFPLAFNAVITNPPFKHAEAFVRTALKATEFRQGKVAMLCRLAFLESNKRRVLFEETPLSAVHVFSWRIPMWRNGVKPEGQSGKMMPYAWFVWDHAKDPDDSPELFWLAKP